MCLVSDRLSDGWQQGSHMFWEDYSGHRQQHGVEVGEAEMEQSGMNANSWCPWHRRKGRI